MKRNKMMRLASGFLIATLVTTSVISGTLAKYTTSGSANDNARVAKFGVVINASGSLYSDAYDGGTDTGKPAVDYASDHMTVASATEGDNVVAPGTRSRDEGLNFSVSGTPEAAVTVAATIKAKDIFLKEGYYGVMTKADVSRESFVTDGSLYTKTGTVYEWVRDGAAVYSSSAEYYKMSRDTEICCSVPYYPVQYKLAGMTNNDGAPDKTANTAAALLAKAVNGGTAVTGNLDEDTQVITYEVPAGTEISDSNVYAPNVDLAAEGPKLGGEKLTWVWDFAHSHYIPSGVDTILGDMMAAESVDPADAKYFVVVRSGGRYTDVTYDSINHLAKSGNEVIASLQTSFDIEQTVTQVD